MSIQLLVFLPPFLSPKSCPQPAIFRKATWNPAVRLRQPSPLLPSTSKHKPRCHRGPSAEEGRGIRTAHKPDQQPCEQPSASANIYGRIPGANESNGTWLVEIHANHCLSEAEWNLGKHVEVHGTELYGIYQATCYATEWVAENSQTNTIWLFADNQTATKRCAIPKPTAEHLAIRIVNNFHGLLQTRADIGEGCGRTLGRRASGNTRAPLRPDSCGT